MHAGHPKRRPQPRQSVSGAYPRLFRNRRVCSPRSPCLPSPPAAGATETRRVAGGHCADRPDRSSVAGATVGRPGSRTAEYRPDADIDHRFERRRRRDEDDRNVADAGADDRHVSGMVGDAVVLLERRVVFLVDDDQAEIGERQEKRGSARQRQPAPRRRARRATCAGGRGRYLRMPTVRRCAEPGFEAAEPLGAQGDFRQQHQNLPVAGESIGDGLEVHFGFPGSRLAVEEMDGEAWAFVAAAAKCRRRPLLIRGEAQARPPPIGDGSVPPPATLQRNHAQVGKSADDAGSDARLAREFDRAIAAVPSASTSITRRRPGVRSIGGRWSFRRKRRASRKRRRAPGDAHGHLEDGARPD